ncbi:MAG: alpha/beta hydrolase [Chloroflexi bacterium]|nr:alpha/beta hydrolase [Chloroflexota bacterium]
MPTRDIRGTPVYYLELGEGRPVLLLHGMPTDHRHMVRAFEPVFEARPGWRRIYPDLPGHGLTPAASWIKTEDDKLGVTLDLVDAIAPGERFVVIGASYGGSLALGAVHRRGVDLDGLMLLVTNPLPDERASLPAHHVFVRDDEVVASVADDERGWLQIATVQTAEALHGFRTTILPAVRIADHDFLDRVQPFSFDLAPLPEPFPRPALILNGRQDGLTGYADSLELLESFPRGTFAILDRAGHPLPFEQPTLFRALVDEWLDRVEAEA